MDWIAGVGEMTEEALDFFRKEDKISGILFGDYFCSRKMYEGGAAEMLKGVQKAVQAGKRVFFRTKAFASPFDYAQILETVSVICSLDPRAAILCQDIGLASDIRKEFPSHEIVWGRMSRNREDLITSESVKFLLHKNITSVAATEEKRLSRFRNLGMKVYGVYGDYSWTTFGRTCYNADQISVPVEECGRACRQGWYLRKSGSDYRISMDGYVLGEKYMYQRDAFGILNNCEACFVEADSLKTWKKRFEEVLTLEPKAVEIYNRRLQTGGL